MADVKPILVSQYLATLEMLKESVVRCPDALWDRAEDKARFWHVAYHALFYTHLYLQPTGADFIPWSKHREHYNVMGGHLPYPPHTAVDTSEAYDKASILEYLAFCQQEVRTRVPALDLQAPSGFDWLPFGKMELQIYTIRHLQQHAGELMERLGSRAGIDVPWVGMKSLHEQRND